MDRSTTPSAQQGHALVGIPEIHSQSWYQIDNTDVLSVFNTEMLTDASVFVLLFQKVKEVREATGRNIALCHVSFGYVWMSDEDAPIKPHVFFDSVEKDVLIVPLLMQAHFFLVIVDYVNKSVLLVDSKRMNILKDEDIRSLLSTLNDESSTFSIITKKRTELCWQNDGISCGLFVVNHVEIFLNSGNFRGKMDISKKRREYGERLRDFKEILALEYQEGSVQDYVMLSTSFEQPTPRASMKRKSAKGKDNNGKEANNKDGKDHGTIPKKMRKSPRNH